MLLLTTLLLRETYTQGAHGSAPAADAGTEDHDTTYAAPYSAAAAARFGTLGLSGCTRARDGEAAARAVDAGLRLMAGFDFARARLAFRSGHGAATDPGSGSGSGSVRPLRCAMCAWGEALCLGPTLNAPARAAGLRAAQSLAAEAVALLEAEATSLKAESSAEGSAEGVAEGSVGNSAESRDESKVESRAESRAEANRTSGGGVVSAIGSGSGCNRARVCASASRP